MKTNGLIAILVLAGLGHLPVPAAADERITAEVECSPDELQELVYDCVFTLEGKASGTPVTDAEFKVGANMPSMPGAHSVRPVTAEPDVTSGTYRARISLEMTGEWALSLDFTKPRRDRLIRKLHFGKATVDGGHKH